MVLVADEIGESETEKLWAIKPYIYSSKTVGQSKKKSHSYSIVKYHQKFKLKDAKMLHKAERNCRAGRSFCVHPSLRRPLSHYTSKSEIFIGFRSVNDGVGVCVCVCPYVGSGWCFFTIC